MPLAGERGLERVEAEAADLVERQLHDDGALVRASHSTVSIVAWCSPAGTRMRGRARRLAAGAGRLPAHQSPLMARLTASVPLPVKTTSMPSAPRVAATCSRASSSSRFACWPALWIDDGLPTTASAAVSASIASGRIGVVAAWSR